MKTSKQVIWAIGAILFLFTSCEIVDTDAKLVDAEGYEYQTVKIGDQTWMAENLRTAKTPENLSLTGVSVFGNSDAYLEECGRLYTLQAAQLACPDGWHLPTDADWMELETYLGVSASEINSIGFRGEDIGAGGKLKSESTLWASPNTGATDATSFGAIPVGKQNADGTFTERRLSSYFWSATQTGSNFHYRMLSSTKAGIWRYNEAANVKFSVRYVKD
jgi:uncharacterized protein (TIGR02145 family)